MGQALELSSNAYKLLSIMYYLDIDGNENDLREALAVGRDSYKKALNELKDKGYLAIVKTGGTTYKYLLGQAIKKHDQKYELKHIIDDMIESRMILELRDLTDVELAETKQVAAELYADRQMKRMVEEMEI